MPAEAGIRQISASCAFIWLARPSPEAGVTEEQWFNLIAKCSKNTPAGGQKFYFTTETNSYGEELRVLRVSALKKYFYGSPVLPLALFFFAPPEEEAEDFFPPFFFSR